MEKDQMAYWLIGAACVLAGTSITSGIDFGPAADTFSLVISLVVSYLLICFGGLMWIMAAAKVAKKKE